MQIFNKTIKKILVVTMVSCMFFSTITANASEIEITTTYLESNDSFTKLENGVYSDGATIYIDAQINSSAPNDLLINNNTKGSNYPTETWSWSDGIFEADWQISDFTYTSRLFTGSTEFSVKVKEEARVGDSAHTTKGSYTIYLMTSKNDIATSYTVTSQNEMSLRFYNVKADSQYAFYIQKSNDSCVADGYISVNI